MDWFLYDRNFRRESIKDGQAILAFELNNVFHTIIDSRFLLG